jgi:divalent metal cation (Fe/Co/Zn/Cd) transporter
MPTTSQSSNDQRERTLLAALLLSAWAPLATGYAAFVNRSATQIADLVRRSVELLALATAWGTFRRLRGGDDAAAAERGRLERRVRRATGGAMAVSGVAILVVAVVRTGTAARPGNVWPGLIIAGLGLITNGYFLLRYRRLVRERHDAVIASQQRLYAAKTLTDLGVLSSLAAAAALGGTLAGKVIDLVGSAVVAAYLLWSGVAEMQRGQAG